MSGLKVPMYRQRSHLHFNNMHDLPALLVRHQYNMRLNDGGVKIGNVSRDRLTLEYPPPADCYEIPAPR